ncbi:Clp protease [seawater metagenome]|uniref:Clp protease n=1 Tax=seawater metagenome TaxID=1561972 RepID=A0A5E8CHN3_9ZZZZ
MKRKSTWGYKVKNKKPRAEEESDDDDDEDTSELVWREDNHIFFYSDVDDKSIAKLNHFLFLINKENMKYVYPLKSKTLESSFPPIFLHIKSYGGCVLSALSTIDMIISSQCPVTTIIEGYAASAATMLSIVGHKRYMHKNAHMLIHQMSSSFWGKMEEFKDEMKNLNRLEKKITKIYKKYGNIPDKKYKSILKHDLWWSSSKCLKYDLIDEVL